VLHAAHPPQCDVVSVAVSQPLVSGAALSQSAYPDEQFAYVQVAPLHMAPVLVAVSQAAHPPQWDGVFVGVSQPLVLGAAWLQSAYPDEHPEYVQVVPLHIAPVLVAVSQPAHPAQWAGVLVGVSQPFVSGGVVTQFA
jgi:hypothetical protein